MADNEVTPGNNPDIDNDPEVIAEVKRNRLQHLKLERWKETAGAVAVILQTFKAEAISLTSGLGTLVVGWFQIRKWVVRGRAEVKMAEHRLEHHTESGVGQGFGSGRGRLGHQAGEETVASGQELVMAVEQITSPSVLMDPMNYVTVGLPVIFIWSTILAWVKRRRKNKEKSNA